MGERYRTYQEVNERIRERKAVVLTAEEYLSLVDEKGVSAAAERVDVVTTGTFAPMCSSGAFVNFGHSDPPIKMTRVSLNDVPAYAGLAAVDAYIGATEVSESRGLEYGGAHVIEDLVARRPVHLKATAYGTDCYPRREFEGDLYLDDLNQAFLFNPRNCYQNYAAATNSSNRTIYTYMGILLPRCGNVTYSTSGQLSPLFKDPLYRTVGIGTRVFLGGGQGYVAWEGTQHNPGQTRDDAGVPLGPSGTLSLIGDLKGMNTGFLRACVFEAYGVSLFVGIGVAVPVLDSDLASSLAIRDHQIFTSVFDYSVPSRSRPALRRVSYAELRSGRVELEGKTVRTAPLSSYHKARQITGVLKDWILQGRFFLTEPVANLPLEGTVKALDPKEVS
jgi:uncharacterized protein (DUF39 family)